MLEYSYLLLISTQLKGFRISSLESYVELAAWWIQVNYYDLASTKYLRTNTDTQRDILLKGFII